MTLTNNGKSPTQITTDPNNPDKISLSAYFEHIFRIGNHQNQYLYVLDNRRLPNSWGNGPADSFLYLGLNQVVYTATTEKRGTGLCRACVTIQRKCPKAAMELDLKNGQIWGNHDKIKIKSDMTGPIYAEYPCSRQAVAEIFTMDIKSVEFELFYGGQGFTNFT